MNQVPQITKLTQEHLDQAYDELHDESKLTLNLCNKAIEIALAEQSNEQPLITAEEARKLGAGKAEWRWEDSKWAVINELFPYFTDAQYRAIKPEPVEPTCQVRNDDTGELKTMTREKAKLLQAKTKGVCDWFIPDATLSTNETLQFLFNGIYTYKLKAKLLKPISWSSVPVGVAVVVKEGKRVGKVIGVQVDKISTNSIEVIFGGGDIEAEIEAFFEDDLELAPASEQDWLVYIQGKTDLSRLDGLEIEVDYYSHSTQDFEVAPYLEATGLEEKFKASRITGLAEGYELK